MSEFEYYNQKKEGGVLEDPFMEQMLNSTQNSEIKNNSTKSIILAPFNSTKSHINDDFYKAPEIQELLVSQSAFTYANKCREVNRQYMLNNNAELDNGVYNDNDEDDKPAAKKDDDDGLVGLN